eukprot:6489871-Lingulodinium_polyedra.AAC.1
MRNTPAGPAPYGMMLGKSCGRAGSVAASSGICGIVRTRDIAGLPAPNAWRPASRALRAARA